MSSFESDPEGILRILKEIPEGNFRKQPEEELLKESVEEMYVKSPERTPG